MHVCHGRFRRRAALPEPQRNRHALHQCTSSVECKRATYPLRLKRGKSARTGRQPEKNNIQWSARFAFWRQRSVPSHPRWTRAKVLSGDEPRSRLSSITRLCVLCACVGMHLSFIHECSAVRILFTSSADEPCENLPNACLLPTTSEQAAILLHLPLRIVHWHLVPFSLDAVCVV
jgi:hypothetical protein